MGNPVVEAALVKARAAVEAEDFAAARAELEAQDLAREDVEACQRFEVDELLGQALGRLNEWQAMDDAFTRALDVAAGELEDLDRCKAVWYWVLTLPKEAEAWSFLERQCTAAQQFGKTVGSHSIRQLAAESCAHAHRGQGKIDEARQGAMTILRRLERIGAGRERLQVWRDFLASLG